MSPLLEFIVRGTPKSQQAKSRKRWQESVQAAIPPQAELLAGVLRLRIDFFFNGSTDLDTDNIIKPIQDALQDHIYEDDRIVVDVCSRKVNLNKPPRLINASPALLFALSEPPSDFVLVRVAEAHSQMTFL